MKIIFTFALAGLVLVNGCATTKPLPAGLRTGVQSAGGVKILSAELLADDDGLLIHGVVERESGYGGTSWRHLDVTVYGPGGELLAEEPVKFYPNPIPYSRFGPGRATYDFKLATLPPPNSTIRVAVDCTGLTDCKLARPSN